MSRSDSLGRHVCWAFGDRAEFVLRAADYLREGMACGDRVFYIAPGDPESVHAEISVIDGFHDAVISGAAQVIAVGSAYDGFTPIDPVQQVRYYAEATERALADGHTGLRVAADVTSQVLTPAGLEAFARYEHLVERYMVNHRLTALCGYDRTVLTCEQVAQLACLHPQASPDAAQVRLYASADPQVTVVLAGEIDMASHQLLASALERADPAGDHSAITIDATALEFIDHHGLHVLARYLARRAATAVVRCRRNSSLATLLHVLALPRLQMDVS